MESCSHVSPVGGRVHPVRSPRYRVTHGKSQVVLLAVKTAVHGIAGVNWTLNVMLQVNSPSRHDLAGAVNREHLLPSDIPVEVLEHVKPVAGVLGNEHGTERKTDIRVIQEVVRMSASDCIRYN